MTIKRETRIATRKGCDIFLQELENDRYATHCVQYAGNGNIFQRSNKPKPTFINAGAFDLQVTTLQRKGGEMNGKNCK